jgi:hypothetical protein
LNDLFSALIGVYVHSKTTFLHEVVGRKNVSGHVEELLLFYLSLDNQRSQNFLVFCGKGGKLSDVREKR